MEFHTYDTRLLLQFVHDPFAQCIKTVFGDNAAILPDNASLLPFSKLQQSFDRVSNVLDLIGRAKTSLIEKRLKVFAANKQGATACHRLEYRLVEHAGRREIHEHLVRVEYPRRFAMRQPRKKLQALPDAERVRFAPQRFDI